MAIFTRFECPRCQHVFVTEGDADAFADCPRCQSMALAIGEASSGGGQPTLVRPGPSLASDDGGPVAPRSVEGFGERTGDGGDKGVFSQLLESSDAPAVQHDVTSDHLRMPATLDDMPMTSDEGDDVFNESTVASDLPASVLMTRGLSEEARSDEGFDPFSDEDQVHRAPTEVLRPRQDDDERTEMKPVPSQGPGDLGAGFSNDELESAFDLPDDDEAAWENGPPPSAAAKPATASVLEEDAWENGPPPSVPTKEVSASLPRPPTTGELPRRVSNAALELTRDAGDGDELSFELHEEERNRAVGPGERRGVWDPNFHSGEMKAGAVLLSDLEAQFSGGVRLDAAAEQGNISGNEMQALESAFSQMAGEAPGSRAEDALRQASFDAAHSLMEMPTHSQLQGSAVPAPPGETEPPSLTRRKRPAHLSLSEEAKALAGIPIQPEAGSQNLALELTRGAAATGTTTNEPPARPRASSNDDEGRSRPSPEARFAAEQTEVTDQVRAARPPKPRAAEVPEEPGTFAGFTVMRIAALLFVAVLVGLGTGVAVAPTPEPKPTTPRTRAEQQFSEGNRFYSEGRFDDALGSYRGAIAMDRTFAPAHRAKAAALAKQKRGDEAASAYRAYLEMSPGAVDAAQVREVLQRYEGEATP